MRVLITGVTGFVGSHLAEYLLSLGGIEVYGSYRWRSRLDNLEDLRTKGKLNIIGENSTLVSTAVLERLLQDQVRPDALNLAETDMTDAYAMRRWVGAVRPDRVFHLAAQSYVPGSHGAPLATLQTNIAGEVNLFEAARETGSDPIIHVAGSSEEYGLVLPHESPVKETNPLRPISPYAVSKVAQEMLAYQYHQSYGLRTVVTRGFNHTGPRRGHVFVTSQFARQIAEIEKGLRPPVILTGDLTSVRDWTDVRDMVRAYWLATEKGQPGEVYNVGSGVGYKVGDMLKMLLGLSYDQIEVRQDPTRLRPSDVPLLVADASKFKQATGWEPQIPFQQTLKDLLDYWRKRV